MHELEIELEVGEVLQIGDYSFTLLDIEDATVVVRIDDDSLNGETAVPNQWADEPVGERRGIARR